MQNDTKNHTKYHLESDLSMIIHDHQGRFIKAQTHF